MHTKKKGNVEISRILYKQNDNINKGIEIMKMNQIETLEQKNTVIELKDSLEGFNRGFKQAEKRINKFDDRPFEIIKSVELKIKKERRKVNRS